MCAFDKIRSSEGPVAQAVGRGRADWRRAVIDRDRRARGGLAVQGRRGVIGDAAIAEVAGNRRHIVHHLGDADDHLAGVHCKVGGSAGRACVACRVHYGVGETVGAIDQWLGRGVSPGTCWINRHASDFLTLVVDDHGGAWLGGAAVGRVAVVGGVARVDGTDDAADVIGQGVGRGRARCDGIHRDRVRLRRHAWVARGIEGVGGDIGQALWQVIEQGRARDSPLAISLYGGSAQQDAVGIDVDGCAGRTGAVDVRTGIVGQAAGHDVAHDADDIVGDAGDGRSTRYPA